jgi:hypothetical protein
MVDTSPCEAFKAFAPRIELRQPFGCKTYVHVRKEERKDAKLSSRAKEGIFVGLSRKRKAFKVYFPKTNTFVKTRNARFSPTDFSLSSQVNRYWDEEVDSDYQPSSDEDNTSEVEEAESMEELDSSENDSSDESLEIDIEETPQTEQQSKSSTSTIDSPCFNLKESQNHMKHQQQPVENEQKKMSSKNHLQTV